MAAIAHGSDAGTGAGHGTARQCGRIDSGGRDTVNPWISEFLDQ